MLSAIKRWLHRERLESRQPEPPARSDPQARMAVEEGYAAFRSGDLPRAEAAAAKAIALQHDLVDGHLLMGQLQHARRAYEDAADSYLLASCFAPELAEPHLQLALVRLDCGEFADALEAARAAIERAAGDARAHNAAGAALVNLERLDEARHHFEQAVELDPELVIARSNLAYLLFRDFEQFDAGRRHIELAMAQAPEDTAVLANWTMMMVRDRPQEVAAVCDRLLALDPRQDPVRLNRGLARLSLGEFGAGWDDYEARKSVRCNYVSRRMPWPEWDGSSLAGRGIYVHTEQGLGDEIMFGSCLPDVIRAARRCVVECSPKLLKTFRRSFDAEIVPKPADDAAVAAAAGSGIDCYSALGSLPRYTRRAYTDFPREGAYLKADAERVAYWRARLDALPGALKVGIAWRGGLPSTRRTVRSIALAEWLPILRVPDVAFVDMQHFPSDEELCALRSAHGVTVHRWEESHSDYDDTAALVSALDLVISVQTALVHLGGALGKETWALISVSPEWRYMARGASMPWYPSVRLHRQTIAGDWRGTIADVARLLQQRRDAAR